MGNYEQLKAAVSNVIKTNGTQAITGQVLQNTLLTMINSLGSNYQFVGIAATNTNPGTPDQNVFYIAGEGTYTNFANISVNMGELAVLKWNGAWSKQTVKVGLPPNELNISTLYPTNGESGTNKYTLAGAIAQVPAEYRKAGLNISFKNSDDEEDWVKYQFLGTYRYESDWLNTNNWGQIPNTRQFAEVKGRTNQITKTLLWEHLVSEEDSFGYFNIPFNTINVKPGDILVFSASDGDEWYVYGIFLMKTTTTPIDTNFAKVRIGSEVEATIPLDTEAGIIRFNGKFVGSTIRIYSKGITSEIIDTNNRLKNVEDYSVPFSNTIESRNTYANSSGAINYRVKTDIKKGDSVKVTTNYVGDSFKQIDLYYNGTKFIKKITDTEAVTEFIAEGDITSLRPNLTLSAQVSSAELFVTIEYNRTSILQKNIDALGNEMKTYAKTNELLGYTEYEKTFVAAAKACEVPIDLTDKYDIITLEQIANGTGMGNTSIYAYKEDGSFDTLLKDNKNKVDNFKYTIYPKNVRYKKIRFWPASIGSATELIYKVTVFKKGGYGNVLENYKYDFEVNKKRDYRVLVIGTSYSVGSEWINGLRSYLTRDGSSTFSVFKTAVTGAALRDKQKDREQYPYTSRPTQSSAGNGNTFGSQIEKLKRLMAGTDLDSGETQIYTTESEYPNIIIIEGAANDGPESDEIFNDAKENVYKKVSNVYVNGKLQSSPCEILTPIDEVDRTTYAGAYRYLIETLNTIFPKAQIFCTNTARLNYYGAEDAMSKREKQQQQQNEIIRLFSCNLIDWAGSSHINSIFNNPAIGGGDGTQSNSYKGAPATNDAKDGIHPNSYGGYKLGFVAGMTIEQCYMGLDLWE